MTRASDATLPSPAHPEGDDTKRGNPVTRFLALLGPGLVTGAADDDPSGVATCTQQVEELRAEEAARSSRRSGTPSAGSAPLPG